MRLLAPDDQFYPVIQLCKATKRILHSLPPSERYLKDDIWYVHEVHLPDLFKKAKATGNHETLDYEFARSVVKDKIEYALGKRRITTSSYRTKSPFSVLFLVEDAPDWAVDAVWKAFVKSQHPDLGGDHEVFIDVKKAYDSLLDKRTRD